MSDIIQESIIDHMVSTKENMLASFDIYKNFEKSLAVKIFSWTQKIHKELTSQQELKSWRNGYASDEGIAFNYKYACPCYFMPAQVNNMSVYIEFSNANGCDAILGICFFINKGDDFDDIRESMTTFLQNYFSKKYGSNKYVRSSKVWPCYENLMPPYRSWLEKELIDQLYDESDLMLYPQILELCLAAQAFLDAHPQYVEYLQKKEMGSPHQPVES